MTRLWPHACRVLAAVVAPPRAPAPAMPRARAHGGRAARAAGRRRGRARLPARAVPPGARGPGLAGPPDRAARRGPDRRFPGDPAHAAAPVRPRLHRPVRRGLRPRRAARLGGDAAADRPSDGPASARPVHRGGGRHGAGEDRWAAKRRVLRRRARRQDPALAGGPAARPRPDDRRGVEAGSRRAGAGAPALHGRHRPRPPDPRRVLARPAPRPGRRQPPAARAPGPGRLRPLARGARAHPLLRGHGQAGRVGGRRAPAAGGGRRERAREGERHPLAGRVRGLEPLREAGVDAQRSAARGAGDGRRDPG